MQALTAKMICREAVAMLVKELMARGCEVVPCDAGFANTQLHFFLPYNVLERAWSLETFAEKRLREPVRELVGLMVSRGKRVESFAMDIPPMMLESEQENYAGLWLRMLSQYDLPSDETKTRFDVLLRFAE